MAISQGILKQLAYKQETSWGVLAGATGGKLLRRVTGTFNLTKETYQSQEIRPDYQLVDFRHGVRKSEGSINGELSPGTYKEFIQAALARDFVTGATTGAQTTIAINSVTPAITRSTGSFLTDGFKVGDVVRATGFTNSGNNARNLFLVAVTALSMTVRVLDGGTLTTEAAGASVTVVVFGKKTYGATTSHTDRSFTFEEFYSDASISEVHTGCKVNSIAFQLPATGLTTIDLAFMGKDLTQTGTTQYFTTPTTVGTVGVFASVNGALLLNGAAVALVTGMNFTINRNLTMEPVVGSNTVPDIFEGRILVDGELTIFMQDRSYADLFANEVETSLAVVMTTSNATNADFIAFTFPRIKLNGSNKDDGEKGIVQTFPFQALLNVNGGAGVASEFTNLSVQDSLA